MPSSPVNHIIECCKKGATDALLQALEEADHTKIVDARGNSLLSMTLQCGHWQTFSALVDKGFIHNPSKPLLISACRHQKDDATGITLAIQHEPDINAQDQNQRTALMTACLLGHLKKVKQLMKHQPDTSLQDDQGNTALMDAVQSQHKKIVELMVNNTQNIDQNNHIGQTALIVAVQQKHPSDDIVSLLLDAGADPEKVDERQQSAWLIAKQKHIKISRLIEKHLNSINQIELPFFSQDALPFDDSDQKDNSDPSDQQSSASTSAKSITTPTEDNTDSPIESSSDFSLTAPHKENTKNMNNTNTPASTPNQFEPNTHETTTKSCIDTVDSDSDHNTTDVNNNTQTIQIDDASEATVDHKDSSDHVTQVHNTAGTDGNISAIKNTDLDTFRKQFRINQQEWFHAAKVGNLGGLNRMVLAGIDINCTDDKGCTALIRASGHAKRAVVSFLLHNQANIEYRSDNGSTALSSSIIGNCHRVAGLLLDRNADPNGLGPANCPYTTIAAAQWNEGMLSMLYRYNADLFHLNSKQQNLVHIVAMAAEYTHNISEAKSTLQFLHDHGLDINAVDIHGHTPLMLLCGIQHKKYPVKDREVAAVAHHMIKLGAAVAMTDDRGTSAFDAATHHKLLHTKGVIMNALSWNDDPQ